ncbi:MAG: MucBP domain-containing protein [Lachnospiraceae bacterium]|nr:MucBP domain-containing protein [Lachnospiraceae bacterium]
MALKRMNKFAAVALAAIMASQSGLTSFVPLTVEAKEAAVQEKTVDADSTGKTAKFTWDNVTAYFVLTDRFLNADTSNDHSYGRGLQADGKTPIEGLDTKTNPGTFHGGDIKGLTEKVQDGYFTDLGVNAIWITAPYEQIHGYTSGNVQSNNANTYPDSAGGGFPYYSYHGYWTLDYTCMDKNMGTEAEFEEFVDSCHEKGIRVIMDVVMNHVGYTTMQDAVDYGFDGALKAGWQSYYYGNSTHLMGGGPESEQYWDASASVWSKWWGAGFVRADYPGYDAAGGDDYHMSLSGLPDVITESSAKEVSTPPILVNKWTQEGRLSEEQGELDAFFSENGYKKQPRYYVIKWLTDWVREYGIDGFRCDTAKHVDKDAWNDLKKEGVEALNEWRKNNPNKAGADWTDDFWMTGEAWGHGMGKSEYFTQGGFDSMINFSFPKDGNLASIEATYSNYASEINSDEEFNVLSYLASHDDAAGAAVFGNSNNKNMGTSLLLAPGGVQIYYGNELNRGLGWQNYFTGSDYLDQRYRTDMNWDDYDKATLEHWQKLGQFRNNHPAVGAGQHEKLDGDVYTFSRTYHLEEEDEDKVVVALPQKAGTFSVSVGDVFEEGETLTDAYSGKTYTVSGGAVEATTADAISPILLQGSGIVKPSVNAKAKNGDSYKTDTLSITLKANKVTDTYYSIDGGTKKPYQANDVITIGGDTAYGETTTLTVEGVSEEDGTTKITKIFTYKRSEEPIVSNGIRVEVSKDEFPTAPNIFVYTNDAAETALNGAWPGAVMEDDGDCWVYTNDEAEDAVRIILSLGATSNSGGTWRSTADKVPGLLVEGGAAYTKDSTELTEIQVSVPGRVNIEYVDTEGNVLKSIYRVGAVGKTYTTYPAEIEGYTLTETPSNAKGTFEEESTVTYVYSAGGEVPTKAPTPTPTKEATITPTKGAEATVTPSPTKGAESTEEATPTPTKADNPAGDETEFTMDGFTAVKTSSGVKLMANASGGTGTIRYMFTAEMNGREILIRNFDAEESLTWKPANSGTYKITAYAINRGKIISESTTTTYTAR